MTAFAEKTEIPVYQQAQQAITFLHWARSRRKPHMSTRGPFSSTSGEATDSVSSRVPDELNNPEHQDTTVSAKKTSAKKTGAKKTGAKKTGAKKTGAKKTGAKKTGAKKAGTKKTGAKKTGAKKTAGNRFGKRPFPAFSAEEALEIPRVILEKHGGNPMEPADVASAIDLTPAASRFFYLASAARDYGFTEGSRDTKTITIMPRGIAAIRPKDEEERQNALSDAVNGIELFQKVRDFYKGRELPEDKFLSNVLDRDFKVDPKHHKSFRDIFEANAKFINRRLMDGGHALGAGVPAINRKDFVQFGETSFPRVAFVAMPFSEKGPKPRAPGFFSQVITSLIVPAVTSAEFNVITADRRGSDIIQATIVRELIEADLVIVDLTDHNPNVLFELGIRIAIGKPIVLIRTKDTGAIFDVDNMLRVFSYSENLWPTTLSEDVPKLAAFVRAAWSDREGENASQYMRILAGENWKTR